MQKFFLFAWIRGLGRFSKSRGISFHIRSFQTSIKTCSSDAPTATLTCDAPTSDVDLQLRRRR